ncbi:MAG TPA: UvrD-helicase domain-containing protein [Candidatus Acidoferrum sp.]|nr:UvrD-helicase domain-containing protein [Candidatus Acidoferrum sp.]
MTLFLTFPFVQKILSLWRTFPPFVPSCEKYCELYVKPPHLISPDLIDPYFIRSRLRLTSPHMEPAGTQSDSLTSAQADAVKARGNVLVMAGAGTGKTKTLVARCLDCLDRERVSLNELLIVTFTEAAAAEMRLRLRRELEKKIAASPGDDHWPRQLALFDTAHIGTLHSFCLKLVREHFHEAGLDPQLALLDEGEARQLAAETLDEQFQSHYAGEDVFSRAFQELIQVYGNGRDEKIRALVLRLHNYSQTRPDAAAWLSAQRQAFAAVIPTNWLTWLLNSIGDWRDQWRPILDKQEIAGGKIAALAGILRQLPQTFTRDLGAEVLEQVLSADTDWPKKNSPRKSLATFFEDAAFLRSLASRKNGGDPLIEDWNWIRGPMETLLRLTVEFADTFAKRKRDAGVLDFHDLEQGALQLLWQQPAHDPSAIAAFWRQSLKFVFVDEYQDINAAQDSILAALSRDGADANRFLVGDVKQSIYRFRLADPGIFREYARLWQSGNSRTIALSDNFRSREGILRFVNSVFQLLMREQVGGVAYDDGAALKFGRSPSQDPALESSTELLLRLKIKSEEASGEDDNNDLAALEESAKEARLIACHLNNLVKHKHRIQSEGGIGFREVEFGDMAILLRSPRGKVDIFTREFARAGVPLSIAQDGFYDSPEILDLLSLLQLLDNPLQDVPCLAVLRSPLVGLSLTDLAEIRLVLRKGHFWTALVRCQLPNAGIEPGLRTRLDKFLGRFSRWRKLSRQVSLSQCLEQVLAETAYDDWLKTRPRGEQKTANLDLFLQLTRQFDQFQRQGLFRFLKFVEAQREIEAEPEVPALPPENSVRLMSIHQSKGLEFPVVVVAGLDKKFNDEDLRGEIILDEQFGLCPRVKPPTAGRRYPSLPHWLAQKHQKRESRGEELRLLYVAMTRVRDTLVLSTSLTPKKWETTWSQPVLATPELIAGAGNFADWIGFWFAHHTAGKSADATAGRTAELSWHLVQESEWGDKPGNPPSVNVDASPEQPNDRFNLQEPAAAKKIQEVLGWQYPHAAATMRPAKASVTELRRASEAPDDEAISMFTKPAVFIGARVAARTTANGHRKLSAAEIGAAHHKFMQHVSLTKTNDLVAEAERLARENLLTTDEHAALDFGALADFWDSGFGQSIIVQPPDSVMRELPFTARFSPDEISEITGRNAAPGLADEFIVVQGVADLVVLRPDEIWLVDFKTDHIRTSDLPARTENYSPQLKLYAAALNKIFSRPVTRRALHFLTLGKTIEV